MLCDNCGSVGCKFRGDGRCYCFNFLGVVGTDENTFEKRSKGFAEEYASLCHRYKVHMSEDESDTNAGYFLIQDNRGHDYKRLADLIRTDDKEVFG